MATPSAAKVVTIQAKAACASDSKGGQTPDATSSTTAISSIIGDQHGVLHSSTDAKGKMVMVEEYRGRTDDDGAHKGRAAVEATAETGAYSGEVNCNVASLQSSSSFTSAAHETLVAEIETSGRGGYHVQSRAAAVVAAATAHEDHVDPAVLYAQMYRKHQGDWDPNALKLGVIMRAYLINVPTLVTASTVAMLYI